METTQYLQNSNTAAFGTRFNFPIVQSPNTDTHPDLSLINTNNLMKEFHCFLLTKGGGGGRSRPVDGDVIEFVYSMFLDGCKIVEGQSLNLVLIWILLHLKHV